MKKIAVTQRVDTVSGRSERRDALDQQWFPFLESCGYLALPVPNQPERIVEWLAETGCSGIVLSGGNDLSAYGGDAPERDATEAALIEQAITKRVPLIGVCRGLQMLQHHFGGQLHKVEGHVATRHAIHGAEGAFEVNSYHNYGISDAAAPLSVLGKAPDNTVEWVRHKTAPILGIMWHPEREAAFSRHDIQLFQQHFG